MNSRVQTLLPMLDKLIACTQSILDLDLERDADAESLVELQNAQTGLRQQLEASSLAEMRTNLDIQAKIKLCMELERDVNRKLMIFQNYISEQVSRIQLGNKSRHTYMNGFPQSEGYFIDSKK